VKLGVVDRFEQELAVIEVDGASLTVPRNQLPDGVQPGDAVRFEDDGIVIDEDETARRKQEIDALMDELWED